MTPVEFTSFKDEAPEPHKHLIVTNNLQATNAYGEMSHVWLTNIYHESDDPNEGLFMFDCRDFKIIRLTHWKYA